MNAQPRGHSVPCRVCGLKTYAVDAYCKDHRKESK